MSNEEINSFLSGGSDFIVVEEAKAILFAQHFADSRGIPQKSTYESIVEEYGQKEALIILAACQTMIAGNMYGIPFSAFLSRLKGKKYKGSHLVLRTGYASLRLFAFTPGHYSWILKGFSRIAKCKIWFHSLIITL